MSSAAWSVCWPSWPDGSAAVCRTGRIAAPDHPGLRILVGLARLVPTVGWAVGVSASACAFSQKHIVVRAALGLTIAALAFASSIPGLDRFLADDNIAKPIARATRIAGPKLQEACWAPADDTRFTAFATAMDRKLP